MPREVPALNPLSGRLERGKVWRMTRPKKIDDGALETWLSSHPGWSREGDALVRRYDFPDFSGALCFAVRLGLYAEKKDHHPDLLISWGKAEVRWTTHDAGGLSELDLSGAEAADAFHHP